MTKSENPFFQLGRLLSLCAILFTLVATASSWAALGDVAIFSEGVGWISQRLSGDAFEDAQRAIVFDGLKGVVPSVDEIVYQTDLSGLETF